MKTTLGTLALLTLFTSAPAYPDTVTMTNHLSVNGVVKQMENRIILLDAKFREGTKSLTVYMSEVESIEFNSTTFNPGAPPKVLTIGRPSDSKLPVDPHRLAGDTLVLRGGARKECKLHFIDPQVVRCEGKNNDYSRKSVLKIFIGVR